MTVTDARPDLAHYPRVYEPATRYSDLDPSRRVGREALVRWFEDARTIADRSALPARDPGVRMVVASVRVDVHAPLRIAGRYRVGYGITRIGRSSFDWAYGVFDGDALVATGTSTTVLVVDGAAVPMPVGTRSALEQLQLPHAGPAAGRREHAAARTTRENYPFRYDVRTRFGDLDTYRHVNNVALAGWYLDGLAELHTDVLGYPEGGPLDGLSPSTLAVEYLSVVRYPGIYQLRVGVVESDDPDDRAVHYACALFDGPTCIGLADAVGSVRVADGEGRDVDLRSAFRPFRMRG